jgi:acetyl/propionyl-CoA carboxylase alpha subunit
VSSNRALLAAVLRDGDFLAGETSTAYLESHPPPPDDVLSLEVHAVVASLWAQAARRDGQTLPSGWRNVRSQGQAVTWRTGDRELAVTYVVDGDHFEATVDGHAHSGRVLERDGEALTIEVDGIAHPCLCQSASGSVWIGSPTGQTMLIEVPRFVAGGGEAAALRGPTAPVPGTVIAVDVAPGDAVTVGQTLLVLEAMKLEHRIRAEIDGVVQSVAVVVGDKVDAHQVLVLLEDQ